MRLSHGLGLPLPQYQTEDAAGLDLMAAVPQASPIRLLPGTRLLIPTGLTLEIPNGYEGQVRPRSGLALNHGVTVLNAPGTIDADYRGEIKVLLINLGRETFLITRGQRIAQLVVQAVARAELVDVRALSLSQRAVAGFGSTGLAKRPAAVAAKKPAAKTKSAAAAPAKAAGAKAAPAKAPAAKADVKKPSLPKRAPPAKQKSSARA